MTFQVELVSPERVLYSDQAVQVTARTRGGGDIAFLSGHEPFIGSLLPCELRVTEDDGTVRRFAVRSGFVSVTGTMTDSKVTVLSDAAEAADDIDPEQAEADRSAATAALAADAHDQFAREDLRWAEVRMAAAEATAA